MKSSEIRSKWLEFFASKGHKIEPSASLVPHNDPPCCGSMPEWLR